MRVGRISSASSFGHAVPEIAADWHPDTGSKRRLQQSDIPSGIEFSTPKPVGFIKELIKSYPKKDCVVLDYFAGSGIAPNLVDIS